MQLSDKYDRERLAQSSAANTLRKERESAPHLANSTGRNGQGQTTTATRRTEGRDAVKKKPGEVSDDWRRGKSCEHLMILHFILTSFQVRNLRLVVAVKIVSYIFFTLNGAYWYL
jgi:hypothetical protein